MQQSNPLLDGIKLRNYLEMAGQNKVVGFRGNQETPLQRPSISTPCRTNDDTISVYARHVCNEFRNTFSFNRR